MTSFEKINQNNTQITLDNFYKFLITKQKSKEEFLAFLKNEPHYPNNFSNRAKWDLHNSMKIYEIHYPVNKSPINPSINLLTLDTPKKRHDFLINYHFSRLGF